MLPTNEIPHLVRIEGGRVAASIPLDRAPVTMGRQPDNAIVLALRTISRYHARLHREDGRWILTDLDSRHGTRLNGLWIEQAPVEHGDVISPGAADEVWLLFLEHPDPDAIERLLAHGGDQASQPSPCPACGELIVRPQVRAPLPDACPRCRSLFVPVDALEGGPSHVRTRFRLAMRAVVAGQPCLVREPMPPPLPDVRTAGGAVPAPAPSLTPRSWGSPKLRHAGAVVALAVTPSGLVRVADSAQDVRTWDTETGEEVERLRAPYPVVALSPDGRLALLAHRDTPVVLDTSTGIELWRAPFVGPPPVHAAFDGRGRVAIEGHPHVALFGPDAGAQRVDTPGAPQQIALALALDGSRMLLLGRRAAFARRPGEAQGDSLEPEDGVFYAAALSADGRTAVLALRTEAWDGGDSVEPQLSLLLWRPGEGRVQRLVHELRALPTALAISPDGRLVAWGDAEGRVSALDTRTRAGPSDVLLHDRPVAALAIDAPRGRAISGGADGRVRVLGVAGQPIFDVSGHGPSGAAAALATSRVGRAISLGGDGVLRAWDAASGVQISAWRHAVVAGVRVALDEVGEVALIGERTGVTAYRVTDGGWLWTRPGEGREAPPALGFLGEVGSALIGQGAVVAELDPRRGALRRISPLALEHGRIIGFCDRGRLAVAITAQMVVTFDLASGRLLRRHPVPERWTLEPRRHGDEVWTSPTHVLSADGGDALFLRPGQGLTWLDLADGHTWSLQTAERVSAAAVAAGGRRIAVAFEALGLTVWDPASNLLLARWCPAGRLGPFDARLDALAFSHGGNQLHAGTREGPLLAFDVP